MSYLRTKSFFCSLLIFLPQLFGVAVYAQTYPNPPQNFTIEDVVSLPWSISWTEGDGTVSLPSSALRWFGQVEANVRVEWTPAMLFTEGGSQRILDIPNHLGIWIWNDGVHGEWFDEAGNRRLFRTRWGLPQVGQPIAIELTWDAAGYATLVDGVLRIHDWQTAPTTVFPDPNITNGVIGSRMDGSHPASGSFTLTVNDPALSYDPCSVDVVGTINETVPNDNSGSWSQGIDPSCP